MAWTREKAGYWVVTKRTRALKNGKPTGGITNHDVYRSYNYDQASEWLHNMPLDQPHAWYIISSDRSSQRWK